MCSDHDADQENCELLVERTASIVLQVVFDIASGIGNAAKKDIAHRDITPNNFGHLEGRGYLFDFSAAKVTLNCLHACQMSEEPRQSGHSCAGHDWQLGQASIC